ncbi:MAG: GAF domain-containing protein, partial [Terriglobales bacterium]
MEAALRYLAARAPELRAKQPARVTMPPPVRRALEQLVLPVPLRPVRLDQWCEHIQYTAARLAKLGVPLGQVHDELAKFHPLALAQLSPRFGPRRSVALLTWLHQHIQLVVAEAYVAAQGTAVSALLAVLDAELDAGRLDQLLERLLQQAAQLFPLRWAEVLLVEEGGSRRLRHAAWLGLSPDMILEPAGVGAFFEQILRRGTPAFLLDAANDPRLAQPYFRGLEVKSVWAVPLLRRRARGRPEVLG